MSLIRNPPAPRAAAYAGHHRFEHWRRDNQVYFITSVVREHAPAFATEQAKAVFWRQFEKYTTEFGFMPWVVSLLNNHDHTLGYLKLGENLPLMMQRIHGSVAKLANDLLDVRIVPFWIESGKQNYFDGCIRDVLQLRRAYRYTWMQCVRHGICSDPARYPHTRMYVDLESAVKFAVENDALLENVPYARYGIGDKRKGTLEDMRAEARTPVVLRGPVAKRGAVVETTRSE